MIKVVLCVELLLQPDKVDDNSISEDNIICETYEGNISPLKRRVSKDNFLNNFSGVNSALPLSGIMQMNSIEFNPLDVDNSDIHSSLL